MSEPIDEWVRATFKGPIDENWNLFTAEDVCDEWESTLVRGEVLTWFWLQKVVVFPQAAQVELILNQRLRVIDPLENLEEELGRSSPLILKVGDVLSLRLVVPAEVRRVEVHLLGIEVK